MENTSFSGQQNAGEGAGLYLSLQRLQLLLQVLASLLLLLLLLHQRALFHLQLADLAAQIQLLTRLLLQQLLSRTHTLVSTVTFDL